MGLLDHLRRRDDEQQDKLRSSGRHWKATPGPGTYRIPRDLGDHNQGQEVKLNQVTYSAAPTWRVGTSKRPKFYHTLGGLGLCLEHEGPLRLPTPRNLSPGPGRYFQDCDNAPST